MSFTRQAKREALLNMLEEGLIAIILDARHPDVVVPSYLKNDFDLILKLSYRFGLPDLEIGEDAISVTLSFNKTPHFCHIPFDAIWGISQLSQVDDVAIFIEDVPLEIIEKQESLLLKMEKRREAQKQPFSFSSEKNEERKLQQKPSPKRSHLRLVRPNEHLLEEEDEEDEEEISSEERQEGKSDKTPRKPPIFRIVKSDK